MYYGIDWSGGSKRGKEAAQQVHSTFASGTLQDCRALSISHLIICARVCSHLHGWAGRPLATGSVVRHSAPYRLKVALPHIQSLVADLATRYAVIEANARSAGTKLAESAEDATADSISILARLTLISIDTGLDMATATGEFTLFRAVAAELDKSKLKASFKTLPKNKRKKGSSKPDEEEERKD